MEQFPKKGYDKWGARGEPAVRDAVAERGDIGGRILAAFSSAPVRGGEHGAGGLQP